MTFLLKKAGDKAVEVALNKATYMLECGTDLFVTNINNKIEDILEDTESNNKYKQKAAQIAKRVLPKDDCKDLVAVKFNTSLKEKNENKFSLENLQKKILAEIQEMNDIIQTTNLKQSNYFLCDAFTSLCDGDIESFKEEINKAHDCAVAALMEIKKHPNHLLAVYSILIFCRFCKYSQYGNNIIKGLKRIKITLNEHMMKDKVLNENLKAVTNAYWWTDHQREYLKNVVLFGVATRKFVRTCITFAKHNNCIQFNVYDEKKK
eukprot:302802_1